MTVPSRTVNTPRLIRARQALARDLKAALRVLAASRSARAVLGATLLMDGVLLLLHVAHVYASSVSPGGALTDLRFDLEREGSYGERYEHAKTLICASCLGACFLRTRVLVHAALAAVFALLLADNALQLHEYLGTRAQGRFAWAEGLFARAPRMLAEFAGMVAVATATGALLLVALLRSEREHRAFAAVFLGLFGLLAIFAVGVDLLHAVAGRWNLLGRLVGLVEDGGELVVLSACCAVAVGLCARVTTGRVCPAGAAHGRGVPWA